MFEPFGNSRNANLNHPSQEKPWGLRRRFFHFAEVCHISIHCLKVVGFNLKRDWPDAP